MASSHPTSSNNYTDCYQIMNLDAPNQSRKRQATGDALHDDDFKRQNPYVVQNIDPRAIFFDAVNDHHHQQQSPHGFYPQQQRPAQEHTPPPDEQQEQKKYTDLMRTPMENIAQLGSVMDTPESPEDISLFGSAPGSSSRNNTGYQPYPQNDLRGYRYQDAPAPVQPPMVQQGGSNYQGSQDAAPEYKIVPGPRRSHMLVLKNPDDEEYLTFGHTEPDGTQEVMLVDGRLPIVSVRTKCSLTVNELRRRVGAPEYMNLSTMYSFFRKSKTKASIENTKTILTDYNIKFANCRQREINRFSGFLEEDAVGLAQDLRQLHRKYFEVPPVAQQMVFNLLAKGHTPSQCHVMLKQTAVVLQHITNSLNARQPAVANKQEKLKGNECDLPYHIFNLSTHGFGHVNSIDHYKEQLAIVQKAEIFAEQMSRMPIPAIDTWQNGEKPFVLLSNHEAQHMIVVQFFRLLQKLPKSLRTQELQRFTYTPTGGKMIDMLRLFNYDLSSD